MAKVENVAKYIISCYEVDNLKLQKLLYYCQGVYMTLHDGKELFPEKIEAWVYGPVVPLIYQIQSKDEQLIKPEKNISTDEKTGENCGLSAQEIEAISMTLD